MLTLPSETLIFGHRGASSDAPQNTLPAFQLALDHGAAGVELDVHLTADGELVVIHDFTVDHTTDGTGNVAEMTLSDLKALDAGSWHSEAYRGTRVPTLSEVFELLAGRVLVNVEIKADTTGIELAVAAVLRQYDMLDKVIISSFDPSILQRTQRVLPEVAVGWLYVEGAGFDTQEVLRDLKVNAVHPYHEMIDAAYMEWAKGQGYAVNTWTVNDPQRVLELRDLGVNVVITDHPARLLETLSANSTSIS
jgi:glycerophosphoryl diester phosphodiesterase